jgi:hypothetical protein
MDFTALRTQVMALLQGEGRVAMLLDVPIGSAPNHGRKRPDKIGHHADVETAQSMYPYCSSPCEN